LRLGPPADPRPLQEALAELPRYSWVALASATAARLVAPALLACAPRPRLAVVGPSTAAALQELGLPVDLCASTANAEGLLDALLTLLQQEGRSPRKERILLPRAAEGRQALAAGLVAAGATVCAVTAYEMRAAEPAELTAMVALLEAGAVDLCPFGSPRTAEIVLAALGPAAPALLGRYAVGAMGSTTEAALRARGVRVDVSAPAPATFAKLLALLVAVHRERAGKM
jgi:uroporphyrinogen-III synthase